MKVIRVVIGSNDGETLAATHLGETDSFYVYDLYEDSERRFVEKRENTARDLGHAKAGKMKEVVKVLEDSDVLVGRRRSPNFVRMAARTRYQPVVVEAERIADALDRLHRSFGTIHELVERRKKGELFGDIPEL